MSYQLFLDIDEIHKLWWGLAAESHVMPIIFLAFRAARKLGITISIKDQISSVVPKDILATCNTVIVFRQMDKDDLIRMERVLNLPTDATCMISKLKDRECIIIDKDLGEPHWATIEHVDLSQLYSIDFIKELMKPKLKQLHFEPTYEASRPGNLQLLPDKTERERMLMVLSAIARNPAKPLSLARQQTGLSANQFNRVLDGLRSLGMIEKPERMSLGRIGSAPYYTEITQTGATYLDEKWENVCLIRGKNKTLKARIMVTIVAQHLCRSDVDWKAEYNGCDLVAVIDGALTCFEIETAVNHHIAKNTRRNIADLSCERVVIVMETIEQLGSAMEICRTRLSPEEIRGTEFKQIKEYMNNG